MPPFKLSDSDLTAIVAFIHDQKTQADAAVGGRRSVDVADLQTGNAAAGKRYFDDDVHALPFRHRRSRRAGDAAAGTRAAAADALPESTRTQPSVTVTLAPGQDTIDARQVEVVTGTLAYRDEFTIALTDAAGWYRSWPTKQVRFTVDDPLQAHVEQLGKYTDADMHDVLAYLQTLR